MLSTFPQIYGTKSSYISLYAHLGRIESPLAPQFTCATASSTCLFSSYAKIDCKAASFSQSSNADKRSFVFEQMQFVVKSHLLFKCVHRISGR